MKIEDFRTDLHEQLAIRANANMSTEEEEFLQYATDLLSDGEEYDDFIECDYNGISRRNAPMEIDGYSIGEADGTCCVFLSDYRGEHGNDVILSEDITSLFKKMRRFVEESVKSELYKELEESTNEYEFSQTLYYKSENIYKFRFILLTDAYNKQRKKNLKDEKIAGKITELNVWDISRIFDVVSSKIQKESIEINLKDFGSDGIPCVKAVDYEHAVADIEVASSAFGDNAGEQEPDNIIKYSSYLAVVPGQVLCDMYLEYGARLLEGNVRSFLSVRGKVNKSIQNTIKNYPEMFFAYNNGIAATATEMDTELTADGLKIVRIKDLQIVNGGQTTASIANTILTSKSNENVDISRLFVPMKISVLEHSMSERIIPKISEYSNSQNKVDASDFFSNHPFHIRMEDYSLKTPAPAVHGNQFQQYWYYERARGQYNQGKMKFKPKSSQLRQYETRYPEDQVIKLVDLARYMELYQGAPDIVSKGKQALVKTFADEIKNQWDKSDTEFNAFYYKRVVALAIMYRKTDDIIKNLDWYKEKHSYKANVVAYSLSVLLEHVKNVKGYSFDFIRIWNAQDIYPELAQELQVLCTEVYAFITREDRLTENVTEWCKREECWKRAKQETWTFQLDFMKTLIGDVQLKDDAHEARQTRKRDNEINDLKFIMSEGVDYWKKVYDWGKSRYLLSDMELSILRIVLSMETTGKIPTEKQADVIIRTRERLIKEGMPMKFV
jgi:hypothetical protein